MTAREKTIQTQEGLARAGISVSYDDAWTLRRASMTLHRWAERECGNEWGCIERDEGTGIPYWLNSATMQKVRTPDLEKGALKRVREVCNRNGLYFYHQTDPRGLSLYVSDKPLSSRNYSTDGVAIY